MERDRTPRSRPRHGGPRRVGGAKVPRLAGLTAFAGACILGTGLAVAAVAGAHALAWGASQTGCQTEVTVASSSASAPDPAPIVTGSSAPAPGPVPTVTGSSGPATISPPPVAPCVSVHPAEGTGAPGQTASFGIQITSVSVLDDVTVQLSATASRPPGLPAPTFTSCPGGNGTQTCTVAALQASQATDLQAQVLVPAAAPDGDTVTLAATVTSTLGVVTGAATVEVVAPSPSPTSPTSRVSAPPGRPADGGRPHHQGSAGSGPGDAPLTHLPPLVSQADAEHAVNPGGLFPTIYPAPVLPGPTGPAPARATPARYHATAVSDVLPLTARQVGTQVAGLIVLAVAIAAVLVRVQLRRPGTPQD